MDEKTVSFVRKKDSDGRPLPRELVHLEVELKGNYVMVDDIHTAICEYVHRKHPDWERE